MKLELLSLWNENTSVLFKKAQEATAHMPTLFTTPIVYTTICGTQPPCHHCFWRSQSYINPDFQRKTRKSEAISRATAASKYGIQRILIPSGCIGSTLPKAYFDHVSLIKDIARGINPDIEIFGICGPVSKESLKQLKEAGMDGYSCSLEIPNEAIFKNIRPGDDYAARVQTIKDIGTVGMKLWSGFMFGFGESKSDISNAIQFLKQFEIDSLSITPYEQYPYIELEQHPGANFYDWAKLLTIARLYFDRVNIYTRPEYANWGFRGGANAIVPLIINKAEIAKTMLSTGDTTGCKQTDYLERIRAATYAVDYNLAGSSA